MTGMTTIPMPSALFEPHERSVTLGTGVRRHLAPIHDPLLESTVVRGDLDLERELTQFVLREVGRNLRALFTHEGDQALADSDRVQHMVDIDMLERIDWHLGMLGIGGALNHCDSAEPFDRPEPGCPVVE